MKIYKVRELYDKKLTLKGKNIFMCRICFDLITTNIGQGSERFADKNTNLPARVAENRRTLIRHHCQQFDLS